MLRFSTKYRGSNQMLFKVVFLAVFAAASTVSAQIVPTPTPTPRPGTRAANPIIGDNANFDRLRSIEMMNKENSPRTHPLLDRKKGIYRKPSDEEIRVLAVEPDHLATYAELLKQPNTGIVKLSGESSCGANADVVVATPKCASLTMPGAGIAFSFRTESYRLPRLADIVLFQGMFGADSVLQQFLLVDLASVKLEDVTLETAGMTYLVEFPHAKSGDEYIKFGSEIASGLLVNGFMYRNGHPVKSGGTYALRSIAFRGKYLRSIEGVQYDELDFDRRRDIVVAFQVIEIGGDDSVTIVWKRLRDLEAPKLEIKK